MCKQTTSKPVSEKAVYKLTFEAENYIVNKIKEAEKLLEERNKLRSEQGIEVKKKITDELINEIFSEDNDET